MRILLIEDTEDLGEAVALRLKRSGQAVDWVTDGARADAWLKQERFDLVLLDVSLPGLDGFEVLKRLRARGDTVPVLMLTARAQVDDRVGALDLGADDYLVKPFDMRELEARCRALLRRPPEAQAPRQCVGPLELDSVSGEVWLAGTLVDLPLRERRLLEILASVPGRLCTKAALVDRLFGLDDAPGLNAIEVYIARLRKRLGENGVHILTVRGEGYRLVVDD